MSDYDIYGKDEVWAYPDKGVGDCEDYVLEKRRELNRLGMSLADLLITVVRKPDGEGHAVLTVRTDKGDYVLDNLTDKVRRGTRPATASSSGRRSTTPAAGSRSAAASRCWSARFSSGRASIMPSSGRT